MEKKIVTRRQLVLTIGKVYEGNIHEGNIHAGLCVCHYQACELLFGVSLLPKTLRLLPHLVPPLGCEWGEYWWSPDDRASRKEFLEKLYSLYKDDKTNLVDIVNDWLDCPTWEDKKAFNQKLIESYEKDLSFDKTDDAVV